MKTFLRFSRKYLTPYWWWFVVGFALVGLTQFMMIGIIEQTKTGIDAVSAEGADPKTILPYILHIVLLALGIVLVRTASRMMVFTPGRLIEYKVRNDYYSSLLIQRREFYDNHESGDLVSRCSNDIAYIRAAYGFGALQVANVGFTMTLAIGAMVRMDARTTLYLAIPMVIAFLLIQLSIHMMFDHWRKANLQIGAMSSVCLAAYKGISAIQNYHAEPAMAKKFAALNADYMDSQLKVTGVRTFVLPLVEFVSNLSIFVVLWFVGPKVIDGQLTIGQVTAFLGYIGMVMPPLRTMGWMLNVFNRAVPAMERLEEILYAVPKLPETKARQTEEPESKAHLQVKDLSYQFDPTPLDPKPFSLKNIQFDLPPGKVLGIVGPLGSGKSVLLETLLRLNEVPPGNLYLGEDDAHHIDLKDYRDHFSFASQKPLLFSTTLRRNLQVAIPYEDWEKPETEARLLAALETASFDLDPKQFPMGLETEVGEKGIMLSGGQRQRIALARCLLKDAQIYILDDVLSAVDHETEKDIIDALRERVSGKSFIIAGHRISGVQWADEILVVKDGRIVDRGTHESLKSKPGFYQDIYNYQAKDLEEAS